MTTTPLPTEELKEYSKPWFAFKKKQFQIEKNNEALKLLSQLEASIANPPMVDEVDILAHYVWDSNCKTCHGRGRLGINRIPSKEGGSFYQLQLCHCTKLEDSDWLKLEKKMMEQFRATQQADLEIFRSLYRHTFFGGLKYGSVFLKNKAGKLIERIKKSVHWPFTKGGVIEKPGEKK